MNASHEPQTGAVSLHGEIGDYIVPSYHAMGKRKDSSTGQFVGSKEQIQEKAESVLRSALSPGAKGSMLPAQVAITKKKPGQDKKSKPIELVKPTLVNASYSLNNSVQQPFNLEQLPLLSQKSINVTFENDFGRMKVTVVAVLEESTAVILVFKDDESISFIPKNGESLNLLITKDNNMKVMYPGFLFTWTDGKHKLMVLVKEPDTHQDNEE